MRTSSNQPRRDPGGGRGKSGGEDGGRGVVGSTVGKMMRGLSSQMGLADMTRFAADRASRSAMQAARAAGKTASQARTAARHARAESIRDVASRAGVSATTARRWARGAQAPTAATEKAARGKVQRSLGGARGIRAARIAGTSGVGMGAVTVRITSGPNVGSEETRNMGHVRPDPGVLAEVADLLSDGDDEAAAELLGDALLDAYGAGSGVDLSDFMEIVDIPDPTEWVSEEDTEQ